MRNLEALLIGQSHELMMAVPPFLNRAGFSVDVVSTTRLLIKTDDIRDLDYVDNVEHLLPTVLKKYSPKYNLVIAGNDDVLKLILDYSMNQDIKLALLPIVSENHFNHLHSKIGLSQTLRDNHILTPEFKVANGSDELLNHSEAIGYPVFIKIDASGGGAGVFECNSENDVIRIIQQEPPFPLLIQKKISGDLLDLSGFYQNSQLVHFSYSKMEACIRNKFGPSSLRTYTQLAKIDKKVFDQLKSLGSALGIHGFANITAIHSNITDDLYFIEADLRPNVWVDYPKYIGDDPAQAIKKYFKNNETISYPAKMNEMFPENLLIPHFRRISLLAFIFNRHGVWNFTQGYKLKQIIYYFLLQKITAFETLIVKSIKPHIPKNIWMTATFYNRKFKEKITQLIQ